MARIGKHTNILVDDSGGTARDITNDVLEIDGLPMQHDEIEGSGFGQDHGYAVGQFDSQITLTVKFNTTATTGSHTVLSGIVGDNTDRTLTFQFGNNAAPTSGDAEFEGEYLCTAYNVQTAKDGLQQATAKFVPAVASTPPAWGTVA